MKNLLYQCRAKLVSKELDGLRDTYHWLVSPLSVVLQVKNDSFTWNHESILFNEIQKASLKEKRGVLRKRYILSIISSGGEYHFELKPDRFWKSRLPFKVTCQ